MNSNSESIDGLPRQAWNITVVIERPPCYGWDSDGQVSVSMKEEPMAQDMRSWISQLDERGVMDRVKKPAGRARCC